MNLFDESLECPPGMDCNQAVGSSCSIQAISITAVLITFDRIEIRFKLEIRLRQIELKGTFIVQDKF